MELIVSMTSFRDRFKNLPLVFGSLLNQTMKPKKIVVVLDDVDVPYITREMQDYFDRDDFEVIITADDIRPHKKYYYAMQKYRKDIIITVDDDVLYHPDMVASLYSSYLKYPECVHGMVCACVRFHINDRPKLKTSWYFNYKDITEPTYRLVAEGIGGVLYPPNILNIKKRNIDDIREFLTEDDLYLKKLEVEKGIRVVYAPSVLGYAQRPVQLKEGQERALYRINGKTGSKEYIDKIPMPVWNKIRIDK